MTNMPSYRLTIDMSDLDGARLVITTGQSGNPFDRHYDDQIGPWTAGETVPLPFTPAAIEACDRRDADPDALGVTTGQALGVPVKSFWSRAANGERTGTSGNIDAASVVGEIHSTRRRLTMIVGRSRATIAPATS